MKSKQNYIISGLSILCMIFAAHIGSILFQRVNIDVTDEGLYSLSEGTHSILKQVEVPVDLKLYYSKTAANKGTEGLRLFNSHFSYVRDLLGEYVAKSGNNITLDVVDPRPDTEDEEEALAFGLKQFQITQTEKYFFGLVALTEAGGEEIIEFFSPSDKGSLEYQLTKLIYKTQNKQKKRIGIMSNLAVVSNSDNPYMAQLMSMQGRSVQDSWLITKMLQDTAEVKEVSYKTPDFNGIDVLVLVHPRALTKESLYKIDQFVVRGGKLLVFIDPHFTLDHTSLLAGQLSSSPDAAFASILKNWGLDVKMGQLAGDKSLTGMASLGQGMAPMRLLPLVSCDIRCSAQTNDIISSGLDKLKLLFPGVVEAVDVEGVEISPILTTSSEGNSYTITKEDLDNPQAMWDRFSPGTKPVSLAMKALGKFKSFYLERPKFAFKNKKWLKHVGQGTRDGAIVLVTDVDFLHDRYAFQQTFFGPSMVNDNPKIFLNAVDTLSGNSALLSVRTKGIKDRSFDVINDIEKKAEAGTKAAVTKINLNIANFQKELQRLGKKSGVGSEALLRSKGIEKKKELLRGIAELRKELRLVKRAGREKIEMMGKLFQYLNTLLVPVLLIVFAFFWARRRERKSTEGGL